MKCYLLSGRVSNSDYTMQNTPAKGSTGKFYMAGFVFVEQGRGIPGSHCIYGSVEVVKRGNLFSLRFRVIIFFNFNCLDMIVSIVFAGVLWCIDYFFSITGKEDTSIVTHLLPDVV